MRSIYLNILMLKWSIAVIIASLLAATALACRQQVRSSERERTPDRGTLPETNQQSSREALKLPLTSPRILVRKSARVLELYSRDELLRTYKAALGFNPVPDKQREGDGATPEGDFYIFVKNNKSAYYLSLGISYPNAEDAERGLREGLINRTQYRAISDAIRKKTAPPQYTPLGGLIYIHGHGAASDWTWGCVALENEDIRELFDAVKVGTSVTIVP